MLRSILFLLIITHFAHAQQQVKLTYARVDTSKVFSKAMAPVFYNPNAYLTKVVREIPKDIYTCNFGFFCKQELKMHKAHVPVSVRLGSFEYCDMLEQKGSGVR